MRDKAKSVWFEGSNNINCNIKQVKNALENQGEYYTEIISLMPGLTSVELMEQGRDFLTIKTNEGLMKRTNISKRFEANSIFIEFDEEYQAGRKVTAKSHYVEEFTTSDTGIIHHIVLSNVEAPGFLGLFYRKFGKSNIGYAVLNSYKTYFENNDKDEK